MELRQQIYLTDERKIRDLKRASAMMYTGNTQMSPSCSESFSLSDSFGSKLKRSFTANRRLFK